MTFWRPVDWAVAAIQDRFTPQWQGRVGIVTMVVCVILHAVAPFVFPDEPPGILQLSILALTISGGTLVFQARQAAVVEDTGDDVDTHREVTEP